MIQNRGQWLLQQVVMLPFRGTGRRRRPTGILLSSTQGDKVLPHLRRNNCRHQYRHGTDWLGTAWHKRTLGVLVDSKLNVSQQRVLMAKKADSFMLGCSGHCQQVEGGDALMQLSTGETHLECWVQVCALQNKRHRNTGVCPKKDHKSDWGTAASVI